jgi:hypothetical protein
MPKRPNPDSRCPVARGEVDLSYYAARDGAWREIGLGAPARRALVDADLRRVADLAKVTREHIMSLHGFGANTMGRLEAAMGRMAIRSRA